MTRVTGLSIVATAFAAAMAFMLTGNSNAPGPSLAIAQNAEVDTSTVVEMTKGDPDAPVTVIEYASFTCPHCASFHEDVWPQIEENYVDTGKVHFIYRDVYFDRYGLWAAMVARCGGQERFFGIADLIYDQQRDWTRGEPVQIADNLRRIGRTAGIDNETLEACLADADKAQTLVAWYQENAEQDDINSTPSFVINGRKYQNMSYDRFVDVLDGALGE